MNTAIIFKNFENFNKLAWKENSLNVFANVFLSLNVEEEPTLEHEYVKCTFIFS